MGRGVAGPRAVSSLVMRRLALALGFFLAASSLAILGFAIYHAEELPDFGVPGLAALAAIAANVMFMVAFRLKRK